MTKALTRRLALASVRARLEDAHVALATYRMAARTSLKGADWQRLADEMQEEATDLSDLAQRLRKGR